MLDNQIHIRGAVRNITAAPIEQLDAVVRFYAQDRSLLETIIVRMDREIIGPNEIARFELVYPNDRMGFAAIQPSSTAPGAKVPYSDWRRMPVQAAVNCSRRNSEVRIPKTRVVAGCHYV